MLECAQLAAALADTLDELAAGVLVVDGTAGILHANAAGQAMLSDGDLLQATANGKLSCGALTPALRDILTAANGGAAFPVLRGTAIGLLTRDGQRFVATVIPLSGNARRDRNKCHSAVAAVFVRKAEIDLPMPLEAVAVSTSSRAARRAFCRQSSKAGACRKWLVCSVYPTRRSGPICDTCSRRRAPIDNPT
jgi:hypothetical protein